MVEIPDRLACLFTGSVTEAGDSYTIEVPEDELDVGAITAGETYQVAILGDTASVGSDDQQEPPNTAASEPPVSRGEIREVTIEALGDQGDGIAKIERGYVVIVPDAQPDDEVALGDQGDGIAKIERGYVVIVPDAQPDDEVTVEIMDARENFAFAEIRDQSETAE
ncbi:TRAM domain-containing protein [Halococcus thailandensis]|uniref:Deoxyribonuclease/rho motif-related TRAM n=1 Tax=Halococcus thailandensis JCM 13552 TaxID=1227457 RepID=M0NDX2_9EURY|nr:TRAM domain-containing protein [Halococcus thailandensis]EMA55763.1 deoxyribonuclease/rho motif-related TRAM [Halococcus thailandensis JCM 13552]